MNIPVLESTNCVKSLKESGTFDAAVALAAADDKYEFTDSSGTWSSMLEIAALDTDLVGGM